MVWVCCFIMFSRVYCKSWLGDELNGEIKIKTKLFILFLLFFCNLQLRIVCSHLGIILTFDIGNGAKSDKTSHGVPLPGWQPKARGPGTSWAAPARAACAPGSAAPAAQWAAVQAAHASLRRTWATRRTQWAAPWRTGCAGSSRPPVGVAAGADSGPAQGPRLPWIAGHMSKFKHIKIVDVGISD